MSEPYDQSKIRPDVVYKKNGKIFAILEFKVPGSMAEEEFDSAGIPWASSKTRIMEFKATAPEAEGGGLTHFGDRATILMKQLTRYVEVVETTKYAALFSWDYLFLSVYDRLDTELVYGTLISRDGNRGAKLRKAYLGWLMEALDNDGESKLDPPRGPTHDGRQSSARRSARPRAPGRWFWSRRIGPRFWLRRVGQTVWAARERLQQHR
jgi:hypothetical protein